jgi:Protein of unknown function (DUF3667)
MSHLKHHHPNCLNCHYPLAEFDKFCSHCGQKPILPKSSMHDLLHEFFHTFWHLDGKFFMTLHHLLIPGKLTIEFFKGHLKRYAHPIQLFLVLGAFAFGTLASKARKAEESAQRSVDKRHDEYRRKTFLHELDSTRKILVPPQYADAKSQLLSDSLMFKMLYPEGIGVDKEKIEKEVDKALDEEFNKRYLNSKNPSSVSIKLGGGDSKVSYTVATEEDSIHEAREEFKDSIIEALMAISDKSFTQRAVEKADSIEKKKYAGEEDGDAKGFTDGIKAGWDLKSNDILIEKLRPKIDAMKRTGDFKKAIEMHEDTNDISVMGRKLRIPSREMYELTPDEIIEKYEVKGFWLKTFTKQGIKATQGAGDLIHFYMSKLFWATVTMIPALALFFSLVYWRKKHFYVEHVVFLLNFNTAAFLVLIPVLWLSEYGKSYIIPAYFIWFAVHFIASVKAYYQQGWGKTLLKSFIIGFAYLFIATIFVSVGAIIGFAFF